MHKGVFLTQLKSTLWRRGRAELFFSKGMAEQTTEHSPTPSSSPLGVPLASSHWTHFHPPFAGCLSTAIWTKMMSHLSSRIFLLTFPHSITFHTLNRHVVCRARALHLRSLRLNMELSIPDTPHFARWIYSRALKKNQNSKSDQMGVQGENIQTQLGDWHTLLKTGLRCKRTSVIYPKGKVMAKAKHWKDT